MFKIYKKSGSDLYDFTDVCGNITLRSTIQEISEELSFEIARQDFLFESDIVQLYENDKLIFDGLVVKKSKSNEYTESISCFDFGWYLNKNEDIYQFNCSVSEAINRICNDYEIPLGEIVDIPTQITDIKSGELSSIIKEMIEFAQKEQGNRYVWEFWEGKFWVENIRTTPFIYNSKNFGTYEDVSNFLNSPSIETSIENMKNSIKISKQEDKTFSILLEKNDNESIKKYGKMQKLESLSKEDEPKAGNIADNLLKELNKPSKKFSVTLPGNIDCKSGKLMKFNDKFVNDDRNFLITQCTHNITTTGHTMSLEMEVM